MVRLNRLRILNAEFARVYARRLPSREPGEAHPQSGLRYQSHGLEAYRAPDNRRSPPSLTKAAFHQRATRNTSRAAQRRPDSPHASTVFYTPKRSDPLVSDSTDIST